ncbi:hypothetical protein [Natronobacterium texcoconense]|uniref:hypothetical protein n=1 Tax=Natronobacterium texcoconense TaxID=1095778 RepID=UPI001FCDE398|nr:hypothetical protein [Natronobacterium texcoconense]
MLNVGIAVVLSIGVGVGSRYGAGMTASIVLGLATFGFTLVVIYLRGYLVPGTPRLTETYLPERIRRRFHDRPTGIDDDADVDLALKGVGVTLPEDERSDDE